ncbi:sensor histidine kinase [Nonomuraea maritima]|uniref:sensor histidine kinase n=1 Tax=Nonomuraea maritima TaxID=683260 RepID=UPI00371F261A
MARLVPRTLRGRLTTIAMLVVAVVLVVGGAFVLSTVPDNLYGVVHSRVELAVRRTAAEAKTGQLPSELRPQARIHFLRVTTPDGRLVASTPASITDAQDAGMTTFRPDDKGTIATVQRTLRIGAEPEVRYLVKGMTVHTSAGPLIVYASSSLSDVDRALAWLDAFVFVGAPLALAIVGGITWTVVGSALRPVERISAELAEITGRDLSRRVPVPQTSDEISTLARVTNHTLDRLERSAETQRRFVADASHELRSPVAALRTQLEVAGAYPDETDWKLTGMRALAVADHLTAVIDELLLLARLDAGADAHRERVDLRRAVEEQARAREGARVPLFLRLCPTAEIFGSPLQLDRLLTNLLDNAVRHAATRVDVAMSTADGLVTMTVTDDGDGIAPEDRERVFERFTRLESARTKDSGGSGLGLALSREIVAAHGGSIVVADHWPGARFVVVLPLRRDD